MRKNKNIEETDLLALPEQRLVDQYQINDLIEKAMNLGSQREGLALYFWSGLSQGEQNT